MSSAAIVIIISVPPKRNSAGADESLAGTIAAAILAAQAVADTAEDSSAPQTSRIAPGFEDKL